MGPKRNPPHPRSSHSSTSHLPLKESILLESLHDSGFCGSVLTRFSSYISNHTFSVLIEDGAPQFSPSLFLQGSVIRLLLYSLHILSLDNLIKYHGFQYHLCANDIQLYFSTPELSLSSSPTSILRLLD